MSLSYCLCKFVIISAVSLSKPTYRFTAIEQGGKIYFTHTLSSLLSAIAELMPILRDIIKSKVSSIIGQGFLCLWTMSTGNLTVTDSKSEFSPKCYIRQHMLKDPQPFQPIQYKPKLKGSTEASRSRRFLFHQSGFHICRHVILNLTGQN